jgi:hypothetical protein
MVDWFIVTSLTVKHIDVRQSIIPFSSLVVFLLSLRMGLPSSHMQQTGPYGPV